MALDIGQTEISPCVREGEPLMIDAELMEDRGMEIMHVNFVLDCMLAELVGGTV
jgi:hypothetical protein